MASFIYKGTNNPIARHTQPRRDPAVRGVGHAELGAGLRAVARHRHARPGVLSSSALAVLLATTAGMGTLAMASQEISTHDASVEGSQLSYLEAGPSGDQTVILLHRTRFTSETWRELGTIAQLADVGYHVIAIDLPGYGHSERSSVAVEGYLALALKTLQPDGKVAVVSPSMSGGFSLPFVARHADRVARYVPIRPGGHRSLQERVTW